MRTVTRSRRGTPPPHAPETIDQVRNAIDALEARGLGPRFILSGLCSGAYWSFHGALADDRVTAALMLNGAALIWDPNLDKMRDLRAGLRDPWLWRRAARGQVSLGGHWRCCVGRRRRSAGSRAT